jgi:transposase-like protein
MPREPILESVITCPQCGHQETEKMPPFSCVISYECKGCGATLHPADGDCCVYCTYGTVPCPPLQQV